MREIGGYIELDKHKGSIYHNGAVALNCGRACLEYLIKTKNIKKLYIPYFCCESAFSPLKRYGVEREYYSIDKAFRPVFDKKLNDGEYLYIINYYGQLCNDEIAEYKERYGRIIADFSHSYFQKPVSGVDTLYTCRKFFGVSDGGFLYTDKLIDDLIQDESFERIHYVLGRFERGAGEFYEEASNNNDIFDTQGLKKMSKLTENILRSLNYDEISLQRTNNFKFLNERLGESNKLSVKNTKGSFMYPFYAENGAELRKKLQQEKIYIPTLWPDVSEICSQESLEYDYAKNILPLPVDQRYGCDTMKYLADKIINLSK